MKLTQYVSYPKYVLRTPLFPLQFLQNRTGLQEPAFDEALYLASPELQAGLQSTDPKKKAKYAQSILKYYSRACTRCTPFGLFAGCGIGNIGDENQAEIDEISGHSRTTRLDMQYLCSLIQKLESDPELRFRLRYYPNDSLYEIGGKYRYVEYHYHNTLRRHLISSVDAGEELRAILARAAQGATLGELTDEIVSDEITRDEATEFLNEIVDSQILKSELDPCVVGEDVLTQLIDQLLAFPDYPAYATLLKIRDLLRKIDREPIGTTGAYYGEIAELIRSFGIGYEDKFLLQTDLCIATKRNTLTPRVIERFNKVISMLASVSSPFSNPNLQKFKETFYNRYEEQEVPLTAVLDGESGLGYPVQEGGSRDMNVLVNDLVLPYLPSNEMTVTLSPFDQIMFRKFCEYTATHTDRIELTDKELKGLAFVHDLPDNLTVMCSILGPDPDRDQIQIKSIGGVCGATMLGRFCHLHPDIDALCRQVANTEAEKHPELLYAEISHLPEARIGNIASRPAFREATVHYLSNCDREKEHLDISDLTVCVRDNRIVLRSKKYGREVVPRLTCAHNHSLSPLPAYRFLCDLQTQGRTAVLGFQWSPLYNVLSYLPRVEYQNFILSRQRWVVSYDDLKHIDVDSADSTVITAIEEYRQKRKMVSKILIPMADNELYVDLQDADCVRLLLEQLRKFRTLTVEEFLFDSEHAFVQGESGAYANEIIFTLHKK